MPVAQRRATRGARAAAAASIALALLALAACAPEPDPASTPTTSRSASPSADPSAAPSPTSSDPAPGEIALPADCEAIYSPAMRATLEATAPPLNDPGLTMGSSQIVEALELLDSGIPTLRCTWGAPSERGLATNVSLVAQEDAQELVAVLQGVGFACDPVSEGTLCRLDRTMIDQDDNIVDLGESHFFRGNGWVTTAWVGTVPDGYTEDIAATLWG